MLPKTCQTCGKTFITNERQTKYCGPKCGRNATRNNKRQLHDVQFCAVDGEGVTRPDGTHEYNLLSVGNKSLFHSDGSRLTFYDIIPFLWDCFTTNPQASYIGFYLGYDFCMWLKDLPENRARILLTTEGITLRSRTKSGENHLPFPVRHRGWCFDTLGLKQFRLWREGSDARMYICDVGPFFQTSLLNVINPTQWPSGFSLVTDLEYKKIARGKEERGQAIVSHGTPVDLETQEYNILENEILARLMTEYNKGLVNIGIKLKRRQWFGPGQAVQEWMKHVNAPTRKEFEQITHSFLRSALRGSYYGGWFEIFAHGHIPGKSWSYDINSAYPHIQSQLPCCLHGKWTGGINEDYPSDYTLIFGTVSGSNNYIGSVPHRLKTGHILRPQISRGWYWLHELQIAKQIGLIDSIEVEQWINYDPCTNCQLPFRDLSRLYEDRLKLGKTTISGKARKLVYNSAYGKTAQSLGSAKYANPLYASLITSMCRTRILSIIANHPKGVEDVLMVATDGVTFRHRHTNITPTTIDSDNIIDNQRLGAWTETQHQNLTLFMPGVYWDEDTRDKLRDGEHPTLKSRGVPRKHLAEKIFEIDDLFTNIVAGSSWPTIDLPINFSLISPKQALAWNRWQDCGKVETSNTRHINSNPIMKRIPLAFEENGILRTDCYQTPPGGNINSMPYNKTFGDEESKMLDDYLTPDGTINMLLPDALR